MPALRVLSAAEPALAPCRAALPPLPPPGGVGAAGSGKQQHPLPITLVVASVDSGGLFHDAIVVRVCSAVYARFSVCCAVHQSFIHMRLLLVQSLGC
jgi:hypothetical protein